MTFCDLSPFYCESGGGIRTYHRAKVEWFLRQDRHRYTLLYPGPRYEVTPLSPTVTLVRVRGVAVTRDPLGYRILLGFRRAWDEVRGLEPDVLEADDPWLSAPLALLMRRWGGFHGLLSSFYHSDAVATYLEKGVGARRRLVAPADRLFSWLQSRFDVTLVASSAMEASLRKRGVIRVVKVPFGVDAPLFDIPRPRPSGRPLRLLYAGRLHDDKDIGLLIDVLPELLAWPDVEVTVAGTGPRREHFAKLDAPRFRYAGFVRDPAAMHALYAENDIFLAPGRYETFGLAALEASAAGLVVVGPAAGGTGELLAQMQSPFVFAAGDRASFIETIRAARGSDLAAWSQRSRHCARTYGTWADAIGRQVQAYEELTAASRL